MDEIITEKNQSKDIKDLMTAKLKAKGEIGNITKSGVNSFYKGAKYVTQKDVDECIAPVLLKNNIDISQWIIDDRTLVTRLYHVETGQWESHECVLPIWGTGNKVNECFEKQSAITYYSPRQTCMILGVGDGTNAEEIPIEQNTQQSSFVTDTQAEDIKTKLMKCSQDFQDNFMKHYGTMNNVPKSQYNSLMERMTKDISEQQEVSDSEQQEVSNA